MHSCVTGATICVLTGMISHGVGGSRRRDGPALARPTVALLGALNNVSP
jgi:hypothetical protein